MNWCLSLESIIDKILRTFFPCKKVPKPSKNQLARQKDLEGAALNHPGTFEKVRSKLLFACGAAKANAFAIGGQGV